MNQTIFFDEIAQIFLADGNFHITLGVSTGEVSPDGEDMKVAAASLIVPQNKLIKIIPELELAISKLTGEKIKSESKTKSKETASKSYEGNPIIYNEK
tara:strand:+ start:392 stop:685 length:294 start_codon:yes stop_codon:yes gene_type:complete